MSGHTDLPWKVESNPNANYGSEIHSSAKVKAKRVVCRLGGPDRDANAELIVKAVNNNQHLMNALRAVVAADEACDSQYMNDAIWAARAALKACGEN